MDILPCPSLQPTCTPVLQTLELLHTITLDVEGTGDDVDDAHGETAVANDNAPLAAVADVGHHALDDQKDTSNENVCSVMFNKWHD